MVYKFTVCVPWHLIHMFRELGHETYYDCHGRSSLTSLSVKPIPYCITNHVLLLTMVRTLFVLLALLFCLTHLQAFSYQCSIIIPEIG